jgi:hypothetical protein
VVSMTDLYGRILGFLDWNYIIIIIIIILVFEHYFSKIPSTSNLQYTIQV